MAADIQRFGRLNATLGEFVANQVLRQLGARLRRLREAGTVLDVAVGSSYVNDFPNQGRLQRVVVQADARPSPARFLEQALARRLAPRLRAHEMLAHWGPAQFVVVLPDADVPGALVLAEDLRQLASAARDDGLAPVSVSIGVHGRRAGAEQDLRELAAEMVIAAQRALEATEANGPGRIEIEP